MLLSTSNIVLQETVNEDDTAFFTELVFMRDLRPHPHVIRLLGFCTKGNFLVNLD